MRERTERWGPWVAVGIAALSVLITASSLVLREVTRARGYAAADPEAADLVLATLFPAAGALVLSRQPRNAAGWVLLSASLVSVSTLSHQWVYDGTHAGGPQGWLPWVPVAVWLSAWTFWPYWLQPSLLPVLFGDGHRRSPFWRRYTRVVLGTWLFAVVFTMFKADDDVEGMGLPNPLGIAGTGLVAPAIQMSVTLGLWAVASPLAIAGLVRRMRGATGRERAQLQWLMLGLICAVTGGLLAPVMGPVGESMFAAGFAAVPVCVVVAVVRHGLLDVELVVNRTVVYLLLTAAGLLAYVGLVTAVGHWAGERAFAPLVAALVALAAASLRQRVQRVVDRRLFGARHDPLAVVQRVGSRLESALRPEDALRALVATVREELRLPYAAVLGDGLEVAEGVPVAGTRELPVVHAGRRLGTLVLGARHRDERPEPTEEALLSDLARRAAVVLHTARLDDDLRRSRDAAVAAREEERRRLRREMHDGLGPSLAGMALQLESLSGRLAETDPALAARASRLRDGARTAVADVRRIVDGLRPAAVDELGLADALRALAVADERPVVVRVGALPELSAAVEVAAYRIVSEAVHNALRHSGCSRVHVSVSHDGAALLLDVGDDGRGFGAEVTSGVGLSSMHERAEEVGGRLRVASSSAGTRVTAELPA